jgi:arabinoxylan arabinofuranohydrolase
MAVDSTRRHLLVSAGLWTLSATLPAKSGTLSHESANLPRGRNPVLPPEMHVPDPEAHVMPDGRLYVYGSWDQYDDAYCSKQYRVFSTSDLREWTDHGISFSSAEVTWAGKAPFYPGVNWSKPTPFMRKMSEYAKQKRNVKPSPYRPDMLWAPDAVHYRGRYYLFFCMADSSEGVAVSDRPEGPFHQPVRLPCGGIDPAVFVDRDGSAYYYWGQFASRGAKLDASMTAFVPGTEVSNLITETDHYFHEGSSIRRRGDVYYYVYASIERGKPTTLSYATSTSPLGPFTHRGVVIDNAACDPQCWNNHGSIEEVNGQWYVFYHRSSRASERHRRLCIEPISFRDDGTIIEAKMTSQGPGEPFKIGEVIDAWRACEVHGGAWIGPGSGGQEVLTIRDEGNEALFRYVALDRSPKHLTFNGIGEGQIEVYLDDSTTPVVRGQVTNGSTKLLIKQKIASGRYTLRLVFRSPIGLQLASLRFT